MTTMFTIGRRDKSGNFGMLHGPSPSERDMLSEEGQAWEDFIIRFDGDPNTHAPESHRLVWKWSVSLGEWRRYHPRVLHKKNDSGFIRDLGSDAIYIGRGSKWGNPFKIGTNGSREEVVLGYAEWLLNNPKLLEAIPELAGKYLVCFCAPEACHGDILIELANPIVEEGRDQWEFSKYIPDSEDMDIKIQECARYIEVIQKSSAGETDHDIFNAGFTRGLAWGIHKTTRHLDHLTRMQIERYKNANPRLEQDDWDDIPF